MLVSIVIPYYNREKTLMSTLQSVWSQTYRPLEVLLVDNGSTDSSRTLAETFVEQHSSDDFVPRMLHQPVRGAAAARNAGLQCAQGPYVYFFDSDDEMSPDFVADAMAEMLRSQADVVAAETVMVKRDGSLVPRAYGRSSHPVDQILSGLLSTQSMFFDASFLHRLGGWNEQLLYWNDWELGVRVLLSRPSCVWIKQKRYHRIYLHDDSITGRLYSSSFDGIMQAFRAVRTDIDRCDASLQAKSLAALAYREAIMAGLFYREGNPSYARACMAETKQIPVSSLHRKLLHAVYLYTRSGGRAAWRFARIVSRFCLL